jgi:hypothetical protein
MYTLTTILRAKDYALIFDVSKNTACNYFNQDKNNSNSRKITVKLFCALNGFTLDELNAQMSIKSTN